MKTLYVGGEHEVRCDGTSHWCYYKDVPPRLNGPCDCIPPSPTFSKRHHKAIAPIICKAVLEYQSLAEHSDDPYGEDLIQAGQLVLNLSDYFEKDNPQFDRKKFWEACFKGADSGV